MATADDVRAIALSLDGVVEIDVHADTDGFDFRVHNKGFVWSFPEGYGRKRVIRSDIAVLYVGDQLEQEALAKGEPDLFFIAPGYEGWPLVMVRLAKVRKARLKELITDAWAMRGGDIP